MKYIISIVIFLILGSSFVSPEWGFYGHRKINRKAVFTLPQEMLIFYKPNIEFITEHAVDPDKRRYATKYEAERHYIDIDHWGDYPYDNVPREHAHAFMKFANFYAIDGVDTIQFDLSDLYSEMDLNSFFAKDLKDSFYVHINRQLSNDDIIIGCNDLGDVGNIPDTCNHILVVDELRKYGILPYFFPTYYKKLVKAFENKSSKLILQYSADLGHYIGDAHVPLHTTENYNGQLTDQVGIHAFWESRLPELFADAEYDFLVGKAEYIENIDEWIWDVIMDSHELLPEVLDFEKKLSQEYPSDGQFCFENRLEQTIRTQCEAYSREYHTMMDGMVEQRMQDAIHAIGSIWMSAWIDAGQPDLESISDLSWSTKDEDAQKELNELFKAGDIKGRNHDN